MGKDAFQGGWSAVEPLDLHRFKLDWVAGEDDEELAQHLGYEADYVSKRVQNMLAIFRSKREVFAPVVAINEFAFYSLSAMIKAPG